PAFCDPSLVSCRRCSPSHYTRHATPTSPPFFDSTATATTGIYTLSLHDALPIFPPVLGSRSHDVLSGLGPPPLAEGDLLRVGPADRKSTRLNSSHVKISYAVFCLKKKNANDKDSEITTINITSKTVRHDRSQMNI